MNQKYKDQTVIVFTSEPKSALIHKKGSGDWTANIATLSKAEYLLCVHNDKNRSHYGELDNDIERGQAFYIGKIKGVETLDNGRKFIQVSEYAILPNTEIFKNAWKKLTLGGKAEKAQQNPIKYENTQDVLDLFEMQIDDLTWEITEKHEESDLVSVLNFSSLALPDLIDEARKKIAEVAKVPKENVTIKIEF